MPTPQLWNPPVPLVLEVDAGMKIGSYGDGLHITINGTIKWVGSASAPHVFWIDGASEHHY